MSRIELELVPGCYAVCRLAVGAVIPAWAVGGDGFVSVTRTERELSIIVEDGRVPDGVEAERGFAALRVAGVLDFGLVGLLARIAGALAGAGVPLLAISTYETDIVLVRADRLEDATAALREAGFGVSPGVRPR